VLANYLSLNEQKCFLLLPTLVLDRELKFNKLTSVPDLKHCRELRLLNLASNRITSLHHQPFKNLEQLHDLLIPYNQIETLPLDTFVGLKKLQTL
jgi:leucine-rich repeat-containing G protein-coupled receptor 6